MTTSASSKAPLRRVGAVIATLAAVSTAACFAVEGPPARVEGLYAVVRADSLSSATDLSVDVDELVPCIVEGRPGHGWEPAEVWLKPPIDHESDEKYALIDGAWVEDWGVIWVREARPARRRHALAHELAHRSQHATWFVLPSPVEEGLCDLIASECVPEFRNEVVAIRLYGLMLAGMGTRYAMEYSGDLQHLSRSSMHTVHRGPVDFDALLAFEIGEMADDRTTRTAKSRGVGYVIAERLVRRLGWSGLWEHCSRLAERSDDRMAVGDLLALAGLESEKDWRRALIDDIDVDVLAEIVRLDAHTLSALLVAHARSACEAESVDDYLERGDPVIRLQGTAPDIAIPLRDVPELIDAMRARWGGPAESR